MLFCIEKLETNSLYVVLILNRGYKIEVKIIFKILLTFSFIQHKVINIH